jgi:trk system potassium uptake protein TrkA
MRIVIVGGGEIGFALAQTLSTQHAVVVVDHAPDVADRFEPIDAQFILGAATSSDVLGRAGVRDASVLVACTGLDEVNIVTCAMARQIAAALRTICFVSRHDFLDETEQGLNAFGIERVIWPEAQLAADIERIIRTPDALDAESFADGAIRLIEYRLPQESAFVGRRVADLHMPRGSLIVAVRRGESLFIPRGVHELAAGDKAVIMGTPDALEEVRRRLRGTADGARPRVTIIGGGDVGLHLAERLEVGDDVDLVVIERDAVRGEMIAGRLRRALVLNGDGTNLELLESEDIGRSDVMVSVIDNDERNLLASLLARQLGVRRVITRVSKPANLRLFERVGIDVAISARGAAVASVLHQIQGGTTRLLALVEQGAGRVLELDVPQKYAPTALRDLAPPLNSIVGAIVRKSTAIVPRGSDTIEPGDRLIVFTTHNAADRVRDYFTTFPH